VQLDPVMPLADALADQGGVMERVLADRLGLVPGDSFRLGEATFTLRAILERYPDNASAGFGLGPRTIVLTDALAGSGLIVEGTLFSTQYRLDLPERGRSGSTGTTGRGSIPRRGLALARQPSWRGWSRTVRGPDRRLPDPCRPLGAGGGRGRCLGSRARLSGGQDQRDCHVENAGGDAVDDFF